MKANKSFQSLYQKNGIDDHLNLLLITNDDNQHYVLIEDFNRFF